MSAPHCEKCKRNTPGIRVNGLCTLCSNEDTAARALRSAAHRYHTAGETRHGEIEVELYNAALVYSLARAAKAVS